MSKTGSVLEAIHAGIKEPIIAINVVANKTYTAVVKDKDPLT